MPRHRQLSGILLVALSAVVFSTAGLFVKSVSAGAWEVIFWRGVFAILFSLGYIALRQGFRREFFAMRRAGWAIAVLGAIGTGAFVPAFKLTTIANVTLIYAASPVAAALLAWFFLGERVNRATFISVLMALFGVAVIVAGSLDGVHLSGDLLALLMTMAMAGIMVIYRAVPGTPSAGPAVLSSALLLIPAMVFGAPFSVSGYDIAVLAIFGGAFAIASVTLAEGARRIPAPQTALISILETPLAPLLAWLVLSEVPATATLVGGAIVFVAAARAQLADSLS